MAQSDDRGPFLHRSLEELTIDDERSFRHIGIYADLKEVLRRRSYRFRVLPDTGVPRADRALLLNLTYWSADAGGDVLVDAHIGADVVTHVAWHHLAARALGPAERGRPSADALFLGESIASAFDVYLIGRVLGHAPRSSFLETQVPAMAEAAEAAGVSEDAFEALVAGIAAAPEQAFAELRALLFDATSALFRAEDADAAYAALAGFDGHRFGGLLHHYELSNWVLYARAYGDAAPDARAREIDRALRGAKDPVGWLEATWVAPALA